MVVNVNEVAVSHLLHGLYFQKISALSSFRLVLVSESNCIISCDGIENYNTDQCVPVATGESFHQISHGVSQILTADRLMYS